jgi:hypothetical protein
MRFNLSKVPSMWGGANLKGSNFDLSISFVRRRPFVLGQ